jgi:hypothetical protein
MAKARQWRNLGVQVDKADLGRVRKLARLIDTKGGPLSRLLTLDGVAMLEAMCHSLGERAFVELVRRRGVIGALEIWRVTNVPADLMEEVAAKLRNERPAEEIPRPAERETDDPRSEAKAAESESTTLREPEGTL